MLIPVVGLGAGGHAKGLIELLQQSERYTLVGLLDRDLTTQGQTLLGAPILGDDALLPESI